MPMNSGERPGAPLGGHSTKFPPLPKEPVEVAVPAEPEPPATAAPPPRVPPPAPPPEAPAEKPPPPPEPPPLAPVPDRPEPLGLLLLVMVPLVAPMALGVVAKPVVGEVAVLAGLRAEILELTALGGATAPPAAGKPLRSAALPTAPLVGVAEGAEVCAPAGAASPSDSSRATTALRIING